MTYTYHTTALILLKTLITLFKKFPIDVTEVNLVQLRVIRIIIRWKSLSCYNFNECSSGVHKMLQKFVRVLNEQEDFPLAIAWAKELSQTSNLISVKIPTSIYQPKRGSRGSANVLLQYHPKELARQLTLIDHEFLRKINVCKSYTIIIHFVFYW